MLLRNWLTSLFQVGRRLQKLSRRKPVCVPIPIELLEERVLPSSVGTTLFMVVSEANVTIAANVSAFNSSTTHQMNVTWFLVSMGATEGQDFTVTNGTGTATIANGAWSQSVVFAVIDDTLFEATESVKLVVNGTIPDEGAQIYEDSGTLTILDNDS